MSADHEQPPAWIVPLDEKAYTALQEQLARNPQAPEIVAWLDRARQQGYDRVKFIVATEPGQQPFGGQTPPSVGGIYITPSEEPGRRVAQ